MPEEPKLPASICPTLFVPLSAFCNVADRLALRLLSAHVPGCCYTLFQIRSFGEGSLFLLPPLFFLPSFFLFNSGAWTFSILGIRMSTDLFELPILLPQPPESRVLQTQATKPSSAGFDVGFVTMCRAILPYAL